MTREIDQLIEQWRPFAYVIAGDYFLPGGDLADLRQEALIGLFEGLRDFDRDRGVPLRAFLGLTIRRKVITAVKAGTRLKHRQLSESIRHVDLDDETVDAIDAIADQRTDTHRTFVARLELREAISRLPLLSEAERSAVVGFAIGATYRELNRRGTVDKAAIGAVDNAYARGRRKLLACDDDVKEAA